MNLPDCHSARSRAETCGNPNRGETHGSTPDGCPKASMNPDERMDGRVFRLFRASTSDSASPLRAESGRDVSSSEPTRNARFDSRRQPIEDGKAITVCRHSSVGTGLLRVESWPRSAQVGSGGSNARQRSTGASRWSCPGHPNSSRQVALDNVCERPSSRPPRRIVGPRKANACVRLRL